MPNTTNHCQDAKLIAELEELAKKSWGRYQEFSEALRSLATAMQYQDEPLMNASQQRVLASLQSYVESHIKNQMGFSHKIASFWKEICNHLKDKPREDFDRLAEVFRSRIDETLDKMNTFREHAVMVLAEYDHPVSNASDLDRDIEEVRQLRDNIFSNWPWSSNPLPPVNREMVARSRAERALREGETFQEMIKRVSQRHSE